MEIALAFMLFVFAMLGHELGHAWALRETGIRVKAIGVGIPWGICVLFRLNFLRDLFGARCKFILSPLLLGAYVEPYHPLEYYDTTLKEEVYIFGSGPIANFIMFFGIFAILVLYQVSSGNIDAYKGLMMASLFTAGAILLWFARKHISLWVLPVLGIYFSGVLIWSFATMPFREIIDGSGSVIFIGEIISKSITWEGALKTGMLINFAVGAMNLLPLGVLDGGKIVGSIIRRLAPSLEGSFYRAGNYCFIALVCVTLIGDGNRLVNYFL